MTSNMRLFSLIAMLILVASCGEKKNTEEDYLKSLEEESTAPSSENQEMINAVLQQIPSPIEISMMLKESGSSYDAELLNSAENLPNYNTNFQKAINLGI